MRAPRPIWAILLALAAGCSGCATSYTPKVTGPLPFAFTPTSEQCAQLLKERRAYRATEQTAAYVAGAGALLSVLFLGLVEEKAAPAASAGATLLASGVGVFAGSQVESLEWQIDLGACLTQPPPPLPLPTIQEGGPTVPDLPSPETGGMLSASKAFNR